LVAIVLPPRPMQWTFGAHQLAPRVVDPLLLALDEPPVRRDRLVHPLGSLGYLLVYLSGQAVTHPCSKFVDPLAKILDRLAPLPRNDPEASDRERRGEQNAGHVGRGS